MNAACLMQLGSSELTRLLLSRLIAQSWQHALLDYLYGHLEFQMS